MLKMFYLSNLLRARFFILILVSVSLCASRLSEACDTDPTDPAQVSHTFHKSVFQRPFAAFNSLFFKQRPSLTTKPQSHEETISPSAIPVDLRALETQIETPQKQQSDLEKQIKLIEDHKTWASWVMKNLWYLQLLQSNHKAIVDRLKMLQLTQPQPEGYINPHRKKFIEAVKLFKIYEGVKLHNLLDFNNESMGDLRKKFYRTPEISSYLTRSSKYVTFKGENPDLTEDCQSAESKANSDYYEIRIYKLSKDHIPYRPDISDSKFYNSGSLYSVTQVGA